MAAKRRQSRLFVCLRSSLFDSPSESGGSGLGPCSNRSTPALCAASSKRPLPVALAAASATGKPHFGQLGAALDTSVPHSGQSMRAM